MSYNPGGSGNMGGYSTATSSRGGSGGGPSRRRVDAKSRTMHKYTVFDEDVGSRYDYEEEEVSVTGSTLVVYFQSPSFPFSPWLHVEAPPPPKDPDPTHPNCRCESSPDRPQSNRRDRT